MTLLYDAVLLKLFGSRSQENSVVATDWSQVASRQLGGTQEGKEAQRAGIQSVQGLIDADERLTELNSIHGGQFRLEYARLLDAATRYVAAHPGLLLVKWPRTAGAVREILDRQRELWLEDLEPEMETETSLDFVRGTTQ